MKTQTYLTALVCLSLLSACGGGGSKLNLDDKSAALSACEPSSGPIGTDVVCTVTGMTQDSTLFFDKKPVEFILNEEDGAVSFTIPPTLGGEKEVYFQEGDSGVKPVGAFEVTSAVAAGFDEVAPAGGVTTGGTGEVINPSGPGGSGDTPPVYEAPADSDGDGVPDTSDACPGTAPGTTVDATGCVPPPPQPTGAQITEFTVDKAKKTDPENENDADPYFGTYRIHWTVANAKAAYLAGNIFNRASTDSALPAAQQCKMVGTAPYNRYLVTMPKGNSINPNFDENATSSNPKKTYKHYLEGVLCDDSQPSKECKTGSYSQLVKGASKTYAFADDALLKKDTYFYDLKYGAPSEIYKMNPTYELKPALDFPYFPAVNEVNPKCRIDLTQDDGKVKLSDTVFTQSFVHYGSVCLAVQGNDDVWVVKCKSVTAPEAKIESSSAKLVMTPKPAMEVEFSYDYARLGASTVAGCVKTSANWSETTGSGYYKGTCEIKSKTLDVTLTATGMGEANTDSVKYHFSGGSPDLKLEWNHGDGKSPFMAVADCDQTNLPTADCSGNVEFKWTVTNNYEIKREDADGKQTSVASAGSNGLNFKEVRFYQGGEYKDTKTASTGTITMKRDHDHTSWKAEVYDTGGSKTDEQSVSSWDYWESGAGKDNPGTFFEMTDWKHGGCTADDYDDCCGGWDCDGECGVCVETSGPHQSGSMNWGGRHLKKIESDCGMNIEQPDPNKYGYQTGKASGSWNNFSQTCNFTATAYDGSKLTWSNASWTCCQ